jgi:hypothetical protein
VTISVTKKDDGDGAKPTGETYGLASADDKGPVNIITEDPSCAAWGPINQTLADVMKKGWGDRDPAIPGTRWTAQQRAEYESVGKAMRSAADQTVPLAKLTPHRVMRELYEQFIAYARAYSAAIPTYTEHDDSLAGVVTSSGSVLLYMCTAINYGSAEARAPLVPAVAPPPHIAPPNDPNDPPQFLTSADPTCSQWDRLTSQFDTDTKGWQSIDSAIPASKWTAEQRATIDAVIPVMKSYADKVEDLGRQSNNSVLQDLALSSAQYRRAYAESLPTYGPADSYLDSAALRASSIIYAACKATGA